jgi:cadmium resistance protein CadD (predicted permease)
MTPLKIIAYLGSAILIFFGVLFVWGAFSPQGSIGWIFIGLISIGIGFGIIWLTTRSKTSQAASAENVTLKIDLPANVNLDTLKCKSCGGSLTMDNIQMVSGAPIVNCPYCHTTYQLTEDPKW